MTKTIYYSCFIDGKDAELDLSNEEHRFILGYVKHQQPGELFIDEVYPEKCTTFYWSDDPNCDVVLAHAEKYRKFSKDKDNNKIIIQQLYDLASYILKHGTAHQIEIDLDSEILHNFEENEYK